MITLWVIGSAIVLLLGAFYYFFGDPQNISLSQKAGTASSQLLSAAQGNTETAQGLPEEELWWNQLLVEDQLHLAVQLAKKALPTWEKYAAGTDIVYRTAGTGPYIKIDQQLLFYVLQDVQQLSNSNAANRIKLLHQYHDSFVGPVIAMHDGDWPAAYPVKKIFLAVYNITKSALEQNNAGNTKNLLSLSINQSLDCLDISGVYSKLEIVEFLAAHKNQLKIKSV